MDSPPSYLSENVMQWSYDFKAERESQPQFDHLSPRFGLKCRCGNSVFKVKAVPEAGRDHCYQPLYATCTKCKTEFLVFSHTKHGWSASFIKYPDDGSDGEVQPYNCHSCGNSNFRLALELEYPDDDDLDRSAEEAGVTEADLFVYIEIYSKCMQCKTQVLIIGDECD